MQPPEVINGFPRGKDQGGSGWHQKAIQAGFFLYPWQLSTDYFLPAGTMLVDRKMAREAFTGCIIPQISLLCSHICVKATSLKAQALPPTFPSFIGAFPRSSINLPLCLASHIPGATTLLQKI